MTRSRLIAIVSISAVLLGIVGSAQRGSAPASATSATARAVTAANAFIATLSDAEKAKTLFPFDSPQKKNWSNLPSGIFQRNSLRLGDMTDAQRKAAMGLMA